MITGLDLGGGGVARYHYDAGKQRARKIIRKQGSIEDRIYLGGYELYRRYRTGKPDDPVEEIESLHLLDGEQRLLLIDDVIETDRRHANGAPYRTVPIYRYQYSNHLGSACLELDDNAQIISYEEYHPYGTSAYRAMKSQVEAPPKRYRFTGMERDEESGLEYNSARYMLPGVARWISPDPDGLVDSQNLFELCRGNPVRLVDRQGTQSGTPPTLDEQLTEKPEPPLQQDEVAGFTGGPRNYGDEPKSTKVPEENHEVHHFDAPTKPGQVFRYTYDEATKSYTKTQLYDYLPPGTEYGPDAPPPRPTVDELLQQNRENPPAAQRVMLPWMGVTSGIGAGLLGSFMAGISYTGLMFSVFMNTFNQSMSYLKDPDNFQFNSLSFMWDTGTSPLGQVTASAIFGRWNIFNKIPVLNEAGEKMPGPTRSPGLTGATSRRPRPRSRLPVSPCPLRDQ
jgi:RHS repeat-associated protein